MVGHAVAGDHELERLQELPVELEGRVLRRLDDVGHGVAITGQRLVRFVVLVRLRRFLLDHRDGGVQVGGIAFDAVRALDGAGERHPPERAGPLAGVVRVKVLSRSHHSAEVMTTLTELRQHPVEIIVFMNWIGLATGIVFGIMTYAFGPGVRPFTLLNGNILTMAFLLTYGHLRHSNMWIAFTGVAGRILQSPAHHQLHHSTNPAHFDKNLGFALAFWDWAFGTLVIPAKSREPIVFGVAGEAPFRSALGAFFLPCGRFASHALRFVQRIVGGRDAASRAQAPP